MSAPRGAAKRAFRVASATVAAGGSYLGYLAQSVFLDKESRGAKLRQTHAKVARRASLELGALRGPIMKLGQTLSLQTNLLPAETLAELSVLQMRAPGMHPSLVRAQFKSALGHDPEAVFRRFEFAPFAAASLGQVHRAIGTKGERLAVKIQYPGIRSAIENDFKWFRTVSLPAQLSKYLPADVIDEMERQIVAETDYVREAENIGFFQEKLKPLAYLTTPRVYQAYSTDRILTMSLLAGDHLDAFLARRPSQRLRDLVGERLLRLYFFQLLHVGAFHADPHWGNYLFGSDGGIGLVDFGCVKYVPPKFVANLRSIFLYPGPRDSADFRHLLATRYALHGQKLKPTMLRALVRFSQTFFATVYPPDPAAADDAFDFGDGSAVRAFARESANLARARGALPEYVFMARAESGLYQTLHRLAARVHTSRIVREYLEAA